MIDSFRVAKRELTASSEKIAGLTAALRNRDSAVRASQTIIQSYKVRDSLQRVEIRLTNQQYQNTEKDYIALKAEVNVLNRRLTGQKIKTGFAAVFGMAAALIIRSWLIK